MQQPDKNKMIHTARNKEQRPQVEEEYFFPGSMEFHPCSVRATSREEAEKKWVEMRRPVNPPADEPPQGSEAGDINSEEITK